MRAIKHARISQAKGLYRYIPNICLYLYAFTCVFTSKRLIEKTCLFVHVDSFEARHTELYVDGHLGNRRYPLPACAYEKIRTHFMPAFDEDFVGFVELGGLLVIINYSINYILCVKRIDAATFL